MRAKPKTTYVAASPQTWELIRAAYLSGLSAPTVAARFGVSVTALRKRAAREGWTKHAYAQTHPHAHGPAHPHPHAPTPASDPVAAGLDSIVERHMAPLILDPTQAARRALGLAARAVSEGRALDAVRLAQAARAISALGDTLPYGGWGRDDDDNWTDADGRASYLRQMAVTIALNLAERIAAGQSLPPEFEAVRQERRMRGEG